jgi:Protein of unknown function (DUF2637)
MTTPDTSDVPRGAGLFEVTGASGGRFVTNVRRLAGTERTAGSALIGWAAWLLAALGAGLFAVSFAAQYSYILAAKHQSVPSIIEALMLDVMLIVFSLLALGLSRAGKSSRTERALIMACAAASAYMNVSAADVSSPRSVVAFAAPPVCLAIVVDRVIAVIRRHVLGDDEDSAWTALGRAVVATVRLSGIILLYSLRLALAAPETARGLRRMVLNAAPLPETTRQDHPAPAVKAIPETAPGVLPEAAPEVTSRPVLEAVPAIPARSPVVPGKQPGPVTPERLAEFYAADLAEGRVPSKRQIKRDWPVGYDTASELHDHLAAALAAT